MGARISLLCLRAGNGMGGPQHDDEEHDDAYPGRDGVPGMGKLILSVPIGARALAMASPATLLARPIRR